MQKHAFLKKLKWLKQGFSPKEVTRVVGHGV